MNRLPKNERLRSRKQIEHLLTNGKSFFVFPFKVVTGDELRVTSRELQQPNVIARSVSDEATSPLTDSLNTNINFQLLIAVPKRRIKKAVTRNLIKRRTREAWRLHKGKGLLRVMSEKFQQPNVIARSVSDEATSPLTDIFTSNQQINKSANQQSTTIDSPSPFTLPVILQYVADEPLPYATIEESVKTIIRQLGEKISEVKY